MDNNEQYYKFYDQQKSLKIQVKPSSFLELFRFADRYDWILMIIGFIFALSNGVSILFYSQPFGQLVQALSPNKDKQQIVDETLQCVYGFLKNSGLVFLTSWFSSTAWNLTSERQMVRARKLYLTSLLKQQATWHDRQNPNELCSQMYLHIGKVQSALISDMSALLTKSSMSLSGIIISLIHGWQMAVVMIVFLPFMVISGQVYNYFSQKIGKWVQEEHTTLDGGVMEVFDSIKTIKMLGGEQFESVKYSNRLQDIKKQTVLQQIKSRLAFAVMCFSMLMNYTLGFWYGARLISHRIINDNTGLAYEISDVIIIFFTLYISNLSLCAVPSAISNFNISRTSMKKIMLIIQRQSRIIDGNDTVPTILSIQFRNVLFYYQKPLFKNLSFQINPGIVAFVGSSGSGKSTIANLIVRFYDSLQGEIGIITENEQFCNINTYQLKDLRSKIAYVAQQPVLLGKSIRQVLVAENINQQKIQSTLEIVKALNFVKQIGYDTHFELLSGGQKQRIAIARALLKNPEVLILDESTSALDRKTEQQVLTNIHKSGIKFIIMIAHRLETVIQADCIFVISNGQILTSGTYENLLKQGFLDNSGTIMIKSKEIKKQYNKQQILLLEQNKIQKEINNIQQQIIEQKDEIKDFKWIYLLKIISYNKKNYKLYIIGLFAAIISGITLPFCSWLLSHMVVILSQIKQSDQKNISKNQEEVMKLSFGLLIVSFLQLFSLATRGISFTILGTNLNQYLKKTAFQVCIQKPLIQVNKIGNQVLAHLINVNCGDLKNLGSDYLPQFVEINVTALTGLIIAFIYSWQVTLISLSIFPIIILASKCQMSFNMGMSTASDQAHRQTHALILSAVTYHKTVKSVNLQPHILSQYSSKLDVALKISLKYGNIVGIMFGLGQTLISCLFALIFYAGALLIKADVVDVLNLYTAIYAIMFSGVQAGGNLSFLTSITPGKLAACRYFKYISTNQEELSVQSSSINNSNSYLKLIDQQSNQKKVIQTGKLDFEQVIFKYPNRNKNVFTNFNMHISSGMKVALVGRSGSGKSTLTNLLFNLYSVDSGKICIDGHSIDQISTEQLRNTLAIVSQEPVLFNRSVYDNIKYNTDATFEEVIMASKKACAYDFICQGKFGSQNKMTQSCDLNIQMKNMTGFNKLVGIKGCYLSGGQKQRIAIARAIVRNPSIMILDEATSALDNTNERLVQQAMQNMKGVTQLIIAHRLSTIINCDQIYVLNDGQIIQKGTYKQLIENKGYFYNLINITNKK